MQDDPGTVMGSGHHHFAGGRLRLETYHSGNSPHVLHSLCKSNEQGVRVHCKCFRSNEPAERAQNLAPHAAVGSFERLVRAPGGTIGRQTAPFAPIAGEWMGQKRHEKTLEIVREEKNSNLPEIPENILTSNFVLLYTPNK